MTRSRFYLILFLIAPVFYFLLKPFHVADLEIWIAIGRDSLDQLRVIKEDLYTVGPTTEMIYPAGISLLYGLIFKIQGLELVVFLHALVPSIWVLIWYRSLRASNYGRSLVDPWTKEVLFIFVASLLGTTLYFVPRPALIATIPLLAAYDMLSRYKKQSIPTIAICGFVALEIIWTNIHGSFLLLPALILFQSGQYLLRKDFNLWMNRMISAGAVLLATLINPFGWKMFPYVIETVRLSKMRSLTEWFTTQSLYYSFASWYFFIFSGIFVFYLIWLVSKKKEILELIFDPIILVWLMGFVAVRNIFLVFLFLPIFMVMKMNPKNQIERPNQGDNLSKIINSAVIVILTIFIICLSPFLKDRFSKYLPFEYQQTFDFRSHSPQIDYFLRNNEGRIFNTWIYGSDLALQQKNKYFIDTRNIIFPDETVRQYDLFIEKPDAGMEQIKRYDFKYFVISEKDMNLVNWLQKSEDFTEKIHEGPMFLFERKKD